MLKHGRDFRAAKFIMARNFDIMFIAMLAKILTGSKAKLVYDLPDIQEFFFGTGLKAKVLRFLERIILSRLSLLIVTSPGYMRGYFEKLQGYNGRYHVWENKLLAEQMGEMPTPDNMNAQRSKPNPWVVCWHGTLRCPKSMEVLANAARRLGDKVKIYMRGKQTIYPELFEKTFAGIPNVEFGGEYQTPDDLEEIYGPAHFVWSVDYFDAQGNADLLLPNRLYQGGALGVVPLTAEGQESAHYVTENGLGFVLKKPLDDSLVEFIENITWDAYVQKRDENYAQRDTLFIESSKDIRDMLQAIDAS
jgi:succinoglycan biosynthesis protein ExoL